MIVSQRKVAALSTSQALIHHRRPITSMNSNDYAENCDVSICPDAFPQIHPWFSHVAPPPGLPLVALILSEERSTNT